MSQFPSRARTAPRDEPAPETTTFHLENVKLRRLTGADKVAGAASLLLLISLFLPWYGVSASGVTVTLSGTVHRFLYLELILTVLTLTYLIVHATVGWDRTPMNRFSREPVLLFLTIVQLVLVIIPFFDVPDTLIKGVTVGFQYGAFVGLIAAAAAALMVIAPFIRARVRGRG